MKAKLSGIMKELAELIMKDSARVPSSEAAHAALLMAHVAWNRALSRSPEDMAYGSMLREFERSNASFWRELKSHDPEAMISELISYELANYGDDQRQVVVCGSRTCKGATMEMAPRHDRNVV